MVGAALKLYIILRQRYSIRFRLNRKYNSIVGRMTLMEATKDKRPIYYVHTAIMFAFMLLFGYLPSPIETITPLGMKAIGITIGVLYGWIFLGFIWPSFVGMIIYGFSGIVTFNSAFNASFGDSIYVMLFLMFIFAAYFEMVGTTKFIANWFASRKFCEGHPWRLIVMLFIACVLLSCLVGNTPAGLLMWSVLYGLFNAYDFKKGDRFVIFMLGGANYFTALGCAALPFTSYGLLIQGLLFKAVPDAQLPIMRWFLFNIIFLVSFMVLYVLIGKFILKVDPSKLMTGNATYMEELRKQKMTGEQKFSIVILIAFITMLMLPSFLPACGLKTFLSTLGAGGSLGVMISIICFRIHKDGTAKTSFSELASRGLSWEVLLLIAATMPMAAAIESEKTGIVATVVALINNGLGESGGVMLLIFCILAFGIATQVVHNVALLLIFLPILAPVAMSMGVHPALFATVLFLALQSAFFTPASSVQGALVYGNTQWVTVKDAYLFAAVQVVITLGLLCLLAPLGMAIMPF